MKALAMVWNTGNGYSRYGQRIAARLVNDYIFFADVDRNVNGVISYDAELDTGSVKDIVNRYYVKGSAYDGMTIHMNYADQLAIWKELQSIAADTSI